MNKVLSAKLAPYTINQGGFDIEVTMSRPCEDMRFEQHPVDRSIYRAQDGDEVCFYCYEAPGRGFGGAKIGITMIDGSKRFLIGPWSSREGVINNLFHDRDHCVEVLDRTDGNNIVRNVTVKSLEAFGIKFRKQLRWGNELYYLPTAESEPDTKFWHIKGRINYYNRLNSTETVCRGNTEEEAVREALNRTLYPLHDVSEVKPFVPRDWSNGYTFID